MAISNGAWPECGLAGGAITRTARAARLSAALRRKHHDLRLVRSRAELFSDCDPCNPRDLATTLDNGDLLAFLARDLVVGEDVLERLRSFEPGRPHSVTVTPGSDRQRRVERLRRQQSIPARG